MRYLVAALGLLLLLGGLAAVKFKQISSLITMGEQMKKSGPPPETVATSRSEEQIWGGTLTAVGSVVAVKGVAISSEVPGVVSAIRFESGALVKAGQVLVELDSSVERAQLAAIEARRDLAQLHATRTQVLVDSASVGQAQLDTDLSLLRSSRADLGALRAQIVRKVVRAPFAGRLGIRTVNLGQYLSPGTSLTVLEAIGGVFVDFSLPQQQLGAVSLGMPVQLSVEGSGVKGAGTLVAIDPTVDATTRTLKLRAAVPNKDDTLRPGMFATVSVTLPEKGAVVIVPSSAVVHASFGDSVFVVEDKLDEAGSAVKRPDGLVVKIARQQFVRTGESRGDFVAILDGVKAGLEVVTSGAFKLRNNAPIVVNNDVKPTPQIAPRPQNR